jgi:hypothetical protein
MHGLIPVYEAVFDELGKEIKDAPGWLSFLLLCQVLFHHPVFQLRLLKDLLDSFGLEQETGTVATLAAAILYFMNDVLDSWLFPRQRDEKRSEKLFKGFMLLAGAVAVLVILATNAVRAGIVMLAVLGVLLPIFGMFSLALRGEAENGKQPTDSREAVSAAENRVDAVSPADEPAERPKKIQACRKDETGYKRLVSKYEALKEAKDRACRQLGIDHGIYKVSMDLVQKAKGSGPLTSIRFMNSAAKCIRSTVPLAILMGIGLTCADRTPLPLIVGPIVAYLLLKRSFWLKAKHMQKLYKLATETVEANEGHKYKCVEPSLDSHIRLFLWEGNPVDCVSMKS